MRGGRCERSALGLTGMQAAGARWGGLGGGGAVLVPCQACARAVLCVRAVAEIAGDGISTLARQRGAQVPPHSPLVITPCELDFTP